LLTKSRSFPVGPGKATDDLIKDLTETMRHERGIGISAIQVGVPVRLFVLDVGGIAKAYLNPEWTPWRGTKPVPMDEGCLSVRNPVKETQAKQPHFNDKVPRYERINVSYMDHHGSMFTDKLRGLAAQAFQHEDEHLEGKIYLEHLPESTQKWLRESLTPKEGA
jgi:peptide deformylase